MEHLACLISFYLIVKDDLPFHLKATAIFCALIDNRLLAFSLPLLKMTISDLSDYTLNFADIVYFFFLNQIFNKPILEYFDISVLIIMIILSKKRLLGDGDVFLLAIMSIYSDHQSFMWLIFLSSSMALIFALKEKRTKLPFGPFILLSYLLLLF